MSRKFLVKSTENPTIFLPVILIMVCVLRYGFYKVQELDQRDKLRIVRKKNSEISSYVQEYNKLQVELEEFQNKTKYLSKATGKNSLFNDFIFNISEMLPKEINFENIRYVERIVTLTGKSISGEQPEDVYIKQFLGDLKGLNDEVTLIKMGKPSWKAGVTEFVVEVRLKSGDESE